MAQPAAVAANTVKPTEPKDTKEFDELIKKEKFRFMKQVKTYLRAKDTTKVRKEQLKIMSDDASCSKLPGHIKKFKAPPTEGELDGVWKKAVDGDYQFQFVIPKGTSRRRGLELLHWAMIKEQKEIFVESSEAKVEALEVASRKATFVASCQDVFRSAMAEDDASALGLDKTTQPTCKEEWFVQRVEDSYKEVVDAAVKEKKDDEAKSSKVKSEAVDNAMEELKPERVIADYVDKRVKDIVSSGDEMHDNSDTVDGEDAALSNLKRAFSSNMPKNGVGGSDAPRKKHPKVRAERPNLGIEKWWWQGQRWKGYGKGKGSSHGRGAPGGGKGAHSGGKRGGAKGHWK